MTKEIKIILGIGLAVVIGGVVLFTTQAQPIEPSAPVDTQSLVREGSHMTGKKEAKVTIVEFGDYECPACAAAEPALERLRTEYANNSQVNFVFRNFPLPQHRHALVSARAAEAAGTQGKFWEMHDLLYKNQKDWVNNVDSGAIFESYARTLGLDIDVFRQALGQNIYDEVITADRKDGESLGVNATPTIFVNGEKTLGYGYDELRSKIEEKLK